MKPVRICIDKLAFGGNGVGRVDGKVCFVPFSCPGDELLVRVTSDKKSYQTAEIVEGLSLSPDRTEPRCKLFGRCGGCNWQHINYATQLASKLAICCEIIWRGARNPAELAEDVVPSAAEYNYRSRVQFKVHVAGGKIRIGFFRSGSHTVEDAPQGCSIALPILNQALARFRRLLDSYPAPGSISGITLDSAASSLGANISCRGERAFAMEFFKKVAGELGPVTAVYLATEKKRGLTKVWGDDLLVYSMPALLPDDRLLQIGFRPGGFSQVNAVQNETLLRLVRRFADCSGAEHLLDLYCGNGNFSLPMASSVATVTGVEGHEGSIAVARENAVINRIANVEFICRDVAIAVKGLVEAGRHFEIVLLDPPRSGAAEALDAICSLKPEKIIYISCDPGTMARDCASLADRGYAVKSMVPVDMFPQTYHLESVTLLEPL